ncbi:hypothetical protein ABTZ58_03825 [Streptomyces sp. NPDC094143]|uniref:hypothetical protein n=1 Tax=unclassified Streptomyces TaxID=2593676 RepID=UPI003332A62F
MTDTAAADRAALRDRIAKAVQPLLMDTLPKPIAAARATEVADAVLAVLPASTDRAAVLREAADAIAHDRDTTNPSAGKGAYRRGMNRAEELVRRMADEAQP